MANIEISSSERDRIESVLQAAISGSWAEFKSLTDDPFSSDDSMLEQFEDSSKKIQQAGASLKRSAVVKLTDDDTRLITAKFWSDHGTRIILTVHSTDDSASSIISIWNFFQELDLKWLLDS